MHCAAYFLAGLAAGALAAPLEKRSAPSVTITNGTVVGYSTGVVETFKGIPFAQPPTGNLRLKPPQPLNQSFGTLNATIVTQSCPQFYVSTDTSDLATEAAGYLLDTPLLQKITYAGEDCLTLNVQRPAGTTSTSGLPVLVWIFGGGFELGSINFFDATSLIAKSSDLQSPIIFVEMNYRVGGFGFLGGKELSNDGSTNLGLRDQRLALEWVQENIAAFGGDPTKVTIWGESAGAISAFDHTVINGGDHTYNGKPLFRAAIMDSGSIVPTQPVTGTSAQGVYDSVVEAAGCSSANDTLACLRSVDYTTLLNACNSQPNLLGYRSVDLAYLPRPDPADNFFCESPDVSIEADNYAKVPVIIGDQEDEGTLFSLFTSNITTGDELIAYLTSYFPDVENAETLVAGLVSKYPDDLGISGSPFNTGLLNNLYPEYKRLAAILGDVTFTLTRRAYLSYIASEVSAWSYLASYFYGVPAMGTFHGSDLLYAFGLLGENIPTTSIQTYYISFVNTLDPNSLSTSSPLIDWPQWNASSPELLNFQQLENTLIEDNFRQNAYEYLLENHASLRV